MKKSRVWQAIVPGTQNKPQDTLQTRKTPWHGVTKQPPAVPLPGLNVTPEPNEKIKGLAGNCSRQDTLQIRKTPWHGVTKQPPALNRMKKSRVWQAIVPGAHTKPQDTLQIRKTPWHGVTKQPPAVPLPGPNVTPEPNEKIKGPERNEKIKVLAGIPLLGRRAPLFLAQKSVHRAPKTLRAGISAGNSTVPCTETCAPSTKNTSGWDF